MRDFREFLLFHNVLKYLYEYFNISFIHDMQYITDAYYVI